MITVAVPTAVTRHLDFRQAHHLVETLEGLTLDDLRAGAFVNGPQPAGRSPA